MKRFVLITTIALLMVGMCAGVFSAAATKPDDPSLSYVKQTAENEDSSISLWFEHSFKKVMTSDITPSGMDTYSIYTAKNDIENAQFVLYSDTTKTGMNATVTSFTNAEGKSIAAEIYYQMYVTLTDLDTTSVLYSDESNTFIREGEQPDPIVPMTKARKFQLNAGKSQAFYIKMKTPKDAASGWYSAQLNILNADKQTVKTATVYAYVWDFELSDQTALQTSFYLANDNSYNSGAYEAGYKQFYDYLLENRINAMDIPGTLNSSNSYLTDDRVQAIRVTGSGGGNTTTYMDNPSQYSKYKDIYANLSNMKEWDLIKNKLYFYTVDEAMSKEQQDGIGLGGLTIDDVKQRYTQVTNYWPDASTVVPYHENHPYPYYYYGSTMAAADKATIRDGVQEMMNTGSVQIWCPQLYSFTPASEYNSYPQYNGGYYDCRIRTLNGIISGNIKQEERFFNWDTLFGEFKDRISSFISTKNATGGNYKLWTYSAGFNKGYSYCNHLIENTGLQTKMLFWQLYQNDIEGYLYYGTNNWREYDYKTNNYRDNTQTGAFTKTSWNVNKHPYDPRYETNTVYSIYGNGVLFYGYTMGPSIGVPYIGSVRVEQMRDGIEDYQMFTMLSDLKGNDAAKAYVNKVSKNVVNYISMPAFDRSGFSSTLTEYDIMAQTRIELGNAVEAATTESKCDHVYNEGVVTKAADCLTVGEMQYTCKICGTTKTEEIPALHTTGSTFTETIITPVTCTTDGEIRKTCSVCNYSINITVPSHHTNPEKWTYQSKSDTTHTIRCTVCNTDFDTASHHFYTKYTNSCTDDGYKVEYCRDCAFEVQFTDVIPAKGHYLLASETPATCTQKGYVGYKCLNCDYSEGTETDMLPHQFVNRICIVCGTQDTSYIPGDIDSNGKVNLTDLIRMKMYIKNLVQLDEVQLKAADVNSDNKINLSDVVRLKMILKGLA